MLFNQHLPSPADRNPSLTSGQPPRSESFCTHCRHCLYSEAPEGASRTRLSWIVTTTPASGDGTAGAASQAAGMAAASGSEVAVGTAVACPLHGWHASGVQLRAVMQQCGGTKGCHSLLLNEQAPPHVGACGREAGAAAQRNVPALHRIQHAAADIYCSGGWGNARLAHWGGHDEARFGSQLHHETTLLCAARMREPAQKDSRA